MKHDRLRMQLRRWWRPAAALVLVAAAWLLVAPRGPAPTSLALSGPQLQATTPAARSRAAGATPTPRPVRHVVVHVAGAVRHPGVYRVRTPGRLIDAVRRAGGLTDDADLTQINLAARLTDGRAIIVPAATASGSGAGASGGDTGAATGTPPGKLNLNTATAEQLDALDGVGPTTAAAIVALRTKLGGFTRIEQLDDVSGVGEKRLANLRAQLEL
ncbi:MAG: ComEA family DNA-binding protein [Patulibacter sp.]